jgi:Coenzyme PQQ synthesis protein D (PqqD)
MNRANLLPGSITDEDFIAHNDDVIAADCNNEIVLLRVKSARCYGMNEVGTYIWRRLAKPTQVAELLRALQLDFTPAPQDCGAEIVDFLEHLNREGLIVRVRSPVSSSQTP